MSETRTYRVVLTGHTGSTGKALLDLLVASPSFVSVVTIGRRPNAAHQNSPKVKHVQLDNLLDIGNLDPALIQGFDAAFSCLGTPFYDVFKKEKADAYRAVDFGMTTEFAKFARKAGVKSFATITGQGVDSKSKTNMYKVKGEVEDLVRTLGFEHVAFLRPGVLHRGPDATLAEKIVSLGGLVGLPVARMGEAMVWMSMAQTEAVKGYTSKEIREAARRLKADFGLGLARA